MMPASAVILVDTSIFCEILDVPGRAQQRASILQELEDRLRRGESLLLPLATILETGNFIAQKGSGDVRRQAARRFCEQVGKAIDGNSPFTPTPLFEAETMRSWLDQFPEAAMRGQGFGDLSIVEDWRRQCELHPHRRVAIWSLDQHLQGYDRRPGQASSAAKKRG